MTHIIYFDEAKKEDIEAAEEAKVNLIDFKQAIKEGRDLDVKLEDPTASTIYTLSYTSGTTGKPKGTMVSH
jgi:long-chain acyl-CoA synthetase